VPYRIASAFLVFLASTALAGDLVPVAPFAGQKSEDLEHVTSAQFLIKEQIDHSPRARACGTVRRAAGSPVRG